MTEFHFQRIKEGEPTAQSTKSMKIFFPSCGGKSAMFGSCGPINQDSGCVCWTGGCMLTMP